MAKGRAEPIGDDIERRVLLALNLSPIILASPISLPSG
jgi:hypothetical protein